MLGFTNGHPHFQVPIHSTGGAPVFVTPVNGQHERRHGDGPNQEILFGFSHYLLPIRRFGYYDKHTLNPTTNITR